MRDSKAKHTTNRAIFARGTIYWIVLCLLSIAWGRQREAQSQLCLLININDALFIHTFTAKSFIQSEFQISAV